MLQIKQDGWMDPHLPVKEEGRYETDHLPGVGPLTLSNVEGSSGEEAEGNSSCEISIQLHLPL